MAKCKRLLTAGEFEERYEKEVHSLADAIKFAIEKYKRLLANWDKATADELYWICIDGDTCALCRFKNGYCDECPLRLEGIGACGVTGHPWDKMSRSLLAGRKARARRYAEEILRILKRELRKAK